MGIIPIRADNAYVGMALQSLQGTPVAPNYFFRWLDGTKMEFDLKTTEVWEGDGTRHLSQIIKSHQMVKATIKLHPRPIELGFLESAALGIGADTFTTAASSTTVSAGTIVGATTITVAASTGLPGSGTIPLVVGAGTANEEIATFNMPATGAGPFVLTVSASGTLKNIHNTSEIVRQTSQHVLADGVDSPYYTLEYGLGSLNGGAGPSIRITDCKVESIKREAKAGGLFELELELYGIATTSQGSPSTVSYENHNPFLYSQSNGGWTVNGSTTGDAVAVSSFSVTQKNALDTGIQAEQLTLAALVFGNLDIDVKLDLIFQNSSLIAQTYWNGGTVDAQPMGAGTTIVKFTQPDNFHVAQYTIPTLQYTKTKMPEPKKDGKHYKLEVEGKSVSNQSANTYLVQCKVLNTNNVTY